MSDVRNIAIKYRLYPTKEQQIFFSKSFGCCRKIWNLMLSDKKIYYAENQKMLHNTPAQYKKKFPYLKEVDSLALANVQMQLEQAFRNFFQNKKFGMPKFKSKKHCRKESYTTNNQHDSIRLLEKAIHLPKVGNVKAVLHRLPEEGWILKSATVSRNAAGQYYMSCLFAYENKPISHPVKLDHIIGLDYKSDGFYVDSDGNTFGSPKYYRKAHKKLAKEQRRLSNKKKGSNNYWKQKRKVAKVYCHIANQRKDFIHKASAAITKQQDVICIESLNMKALANKGFHNGKATLDNGWGMFVQQLEYKSERNGSILIKVNKWFPSSQLCHACGYQYRPAKNLQIREWTCPSCGVHHDRDVNAAKNIRDEGLRILKAKAKID